MKSNLTILFLSAILTFSFVGCEDDKGEAEPVTIEIKADKTTSDSIVISWTKVEEAVYYTIDISEGTNDPESFIVEDKTSYTFDDLLAGTSYKIEIEAGAAFFSESIVGKGSTSITTATLPTELVGAWEKLSGSSTFRYEFNADGTGLYQAGSFDYDIKWSADDTNITIRTYGGFGYQAVDHTYEIEGDVLTLDGDDMYIKSN
ncbi:MAG: fibronectin type III domain-containing protein [Bacteroidales bacterium]|nr:fibronectin type III domain-containing protein [Bacteroidales bacterium]